MKAKLPFLSFFFFVFSVALATNYYGGSSYFYDFPSCKNLNITMICNNKIDLNEFYFSPNCFLVENQTYVNKWVCNCWNGYKLNFTIHPASNNTCDIYIVYTQTIELPEKREIYIRFSETPIIYNTTLNQTINQTIIEKIVPYVPEDINKTIEELKKSLEVEKEINREIGRSKEAVVNEYMKAIKSNVDLYKVIYGLVIIIIMLVMALAIALKHYYRLKVS
jgi:hypothetical protein